MRGRLAAMGALVLLLAGCGSARLHAGTVPPSPAPLVSSAPPPPSSGPAPTSAPAATPAPVAPAGNPQGRAVVPEEARAEDTSRPDRTVGDGTAPSCTSQAVVAAVAAGGVITFACGPDPVTITMTATAKIRNAAGPRIVLDGGGKVTLSGGGKRRILYLNTCDKAQGHTTSHCQDQDHPRLTLQNLTFADGNSTGEETEGGGGGAVFVRGGRVKVVNSRFVGNRCDPTGPDLGGAGLRVLSQSKGLPVYVVGSTFDGGVCANGGALSSIGVSWVVLNSVLANNSAIGRGANPARPGTPGGGSGGAIYTDGNTFTVRLAGTIVENNKANEGGGAIFFVSNDRTGTMSIEASTLRRNPSAGFETKGLRGIFFLGAANPTVTGSTIQ
ncbi:MAG TPA: hypothetical protein VFV67_18645 [Actinophytocola sp.]|uniref:hypothetical protein n=1 Tax=Actinophytocola sp. TaxID=1872138 RepID=UPI002DB86ED5|nr:hypothetical protein [Actinophytocola sp.]HEU5472670.1 hypothetical protein [Actinophytocola sp.]